MCNRTFSIEPGTYEQWAVHKVAFHTGPDKTAPTAFFCPSYKQAQITKQKWNDVFTEKLKSETDITKVKKIIARWKKCEELLDNVNDSDIYSCYDAHNHTVNTVQLALKDLSIVNDHDMHFSTMRTLHNVQDVFGNRASSLTRHDINMQILFPKRKHGKSRRVYDMDKE